MEKLKTDIGYIDSLGEKRIILVIYIFFFENWRLITEPIKNFDAVKIINEKKLNVKKLLSNSKPKNNKNKHNAAKTWNQYGLNKGILGINSINKKDLIFTNKKKNIKLQSSVKKLKYPISNALNTQYHFNKIKMNVIFWLLETEYKYVKNFEKMLLWLKNTKYFLLNFA